MKEYYPDTVIKVVEEYNMKGGVLVQCFPGQGLVGRIAGMHLIESYNAKMAAKIYSSYFPHLVIFQGRLGKLIHAELWGIDQIDPPFLVLTGESQPQEGPRGMFQVLNSVIDLAEDWGIEKVVAIGGFKPAKMKDTPDVTGFAYTDKEADFLEDHKVKLFTEGRVSGAVGVLTALAAERGLTSFGLMGKVRSRDKPSLAFGVDPYASKDVLAVLSKLLAMDLDLSKMDKMIEDIERTEENAMKLIEKLDSSKKEKGDKSYYI